MFDFASTAKNYSRERKISCSSAKTANETHS